MTVLDGELDGDAETLLQQACTRGAIVRKLSTIFQYAHAPRGNFPYPVASRLRDIFTDLLGRETKRTDLRGKCRRGADLTTGRKEVAARKLVSRCSEAKLLESFVSHT